MSTTWCAPCLPGPLPVPGWRDGARTHISGGRQQRPTRTLRLPETPGSVHSRHSAGACLLGSHIAVRDASHAFLCENTSQMGKACSPEHRTCQHLKMSAPLAWPGLSRLKTLPSVSVSLLPPAGATPRLHPGHDTPSREARGAPRPHSALSVATVTAAVTCFPHGTPSPALSSLRRAVRRTPDAAAVAKSSSHIPKPRERSSLFPLLVLEPSAAEQTRRSNSTKRVTNRRRPTRHLEGAARACGKRKENS